MPSSVRRCYGDHRGISRNRPRVILCWIPEKLDVLIPHFRSPQDRVWMQDAGGRTITIHRGTVPPSGELTTQWALRRINMALSRRTPQGQPGPQSHTAEPCALGKKHPHLQAFLTDTLYDDGQVRTPGSFTIFLAAEGGLRMCLNDKDSDEVAFISAMTMTDLFKRADEGVAKNSLDWRSNKRKGRK